MQFSPLGLAGPPPAYGRQSWPAVQQIGMQAGKASEPEV